MKACWAQLPSIITTRDSTGLKTKATAAARQLYADYVAGELSWLEVHQALHPISPA